LSFFIYRGSGYYLYCFIVTFLIYVSLNKVKLKFFFPLVVIFVILITLGLSFKNYIKTNVHSGGFVKVDKIQDLYPKKVDQFLSKSYKDEIKDFLLFDTNYRNMKFVCEIEKEFMPCFILGRILQRSELLGQFGRIIELTPAQVPYLNGITYKPILYIPVIRPFYNEKPSDKTAEYFGLEYGYKNKNDPNPTVILINIIFEAWMNGGWEYIFIVTIFYGSIIGFVFYAITIRNFNINIIGYTAIPPLINFNNSLFQCFARTLHFALIFTILFIFLNKLSTYINK